MNYAREGCVTCDQSKEKKLDCFARSIVYESCCTICYPGGKTDKLGDKVIMTGRGIYTGETSRSLGERAGEHMVAAKGLDKGFPHGETLVSGPPRGGELTSLQI